MERKYDVFISFKNTDENGQATEDAAIAQEIFKELEGHNICCFFSNIKLFEFGESAYKEAIEDALDEAKVMICIATKLEHLKSNWVKYERESFHEDILSNRKKEAYIIPYLKDIYANDVPRCLRGYETFIIGKNPIENVVDFTIKCLKRNTELSDRNFEKSLTTGRVVSRYNPEYGNEFRRLKIQAKNTRPADMPAIEYALNNIKKDKINILDAGCAYGYVTYDRFKNIENSFTLGLDISDKCLDYAKKNNCSANIAYEFCQFEDDNFENRIEELMEKYHIEEFDIIFSSLVIHHLKNPNKFLRRIRKYLSKDGYIIVRGSDDGSIITYNDDGLIKKIVDLHLNTDGISDRLNGRKIYTQLISSGYKNVKMMNYVKDLSDLDLDERSDYFIERYSYRRNYLQLSCDLDPYDMEKRNNLEAIDFALDLLENKFSDETFWCCETDFVGIAKKR